MKKRFRKSNKKDFENLEKVYEKWLNIINSKKNFKQEFRNEKKINKFHFNQSS